MYNFCLLLAVDKKGLGFPKRLYLFHRLPVSFIVSIQCFYRFFSQSEMAKKLMKLFRLAKINSGNVCMKVLRPFMENQNPPLLTLLIQQPIVKRYTLTTDFKKSHSGEMLMFTPKNTRGMNNYVRN